MSPRLLFGVGNQTGQNLLPLPFKGVLSSYVASPGCVFSFSALGTGYGGRLPGRERSSRWERFLLYNVQLKRREWEQKVSVKQTYRAGTFSGSEALLDTEELSVQLTRAGLDNLLAISLDPLCFQCCWCHSHEAANNRLPQQESSSS